MLQCDSALVTYRAKHGDFVCINHSGHSRRLELCCVVSGARTLSYRPAHSAQTRKSAWMPTNMHGEYYLRTGAAQYCYPIEGSLYHYLAPSDKLRHKITNMYAFLNGQS